MTKGVVSKSSLQNIAQALRDGNGTSNTYSPSQMARGIYDITYHFVPINITKVVYEHRQVVPPSEYFPEGIYIDYYHTDISIVNDKPNEYPNLLYLGYREPCTIENLEAGIRITINEYKTIYPDVSSVLFTGTNINENNINATVTYMEDKRKYGQTYAVYGKRKG